MLIVVSSISEHHVYLLALIVQLSVKNNKLTCCCCHLANSRLARKQTIAAIALAIVILVITLVTCIYVGNVFAVIQAPLIPAFLFVS